MCRIGDRKYFWQDNKLGEKNGIFFLQYFLYCFQRKRGVKIIDVTKPKVKVDRSICFILHSTCKQSQSIFGCAEQFSREIKIKSKSMLNTTIVVGRNQTINKLKLCPKLQQIIIDATCIKYARINRCSLLRATVSGPSLNVCRKHAHQVYSFVYKLSNSTT